MRRGGKRAGCGSRVWQQWVQSVVPRELTCRGPRIGDAGTLKADRADSGQRPERAGEMNGDSLRAAGLQAGLRAAACTAGWLQAGR